MTSYATPNLPSSDFERTVAFYGSLGFGPTYRDDEWLILERDGIVLEFLHDPEVDPLASGFSCCLRLDDLDDFYATCLATGLPEATTGQPRLHPPEAQSGLRIGALVDPDGTLLRLIQN